MDRNQKLKEISEKCERERSQILKRRKEEIAEKRKFSIACQKYIFHGRNFDFFFFFGRQQANISFSFLPVSPKMRR